MLLGFYLRYRTYVLFFCFCSLFSLLFECINVFRLIFLAYWDRVYFLWCVWLTSFILFFAIKTSEICNHIVFSLFWARCGLPRCFYLLNLWWNSRRVHLVTIWGSLGFIFLWTLIRIWLFFWCDSSFLRGTILLNFRIFLIFNGISIFRLSRAYKFSLRQGVRIIVYFVLISKHLF